MKRFFWATMLASVSLLTACEPQRYGRDVSAGDPERLIDVSMEMVTFPAASRNMPAQLASAISQDIPSRAEMHCDRSRTVCMQAYEVLEQHNISVEFSPDAEADEVVLLYERVIARDCDQRYVDNSRNNNNLHYESFGCSVVGNTLQMVSDKRQVASPNLMDLPDARRVVKTYDHYANPKDSDSSVKGSSLSSGSLLNSVSQ